MSSELRFTGGTITAPLVVKTSPRARVMRLRVDPRTGKVLLTVPRRVSRAKALSWAGDQRAWVEAALADIPAATPIVPGCTVPLYGQPHLLKWDSASPRTVRIAEGCLLAGGPEEGLQGRLLRWLRQHARTLLDRETREFAAKAGVEVMKVGVGDPSSRWGSCSSSGNIRYSWRLVLAPDWVRRATVAHEVAHLVHMNHGPRFHALVETLLEEDPKPARQWLRRHGASLHRIAAFP